MGKKWCTGRFWELYLTLAALILLLFVGCAPDSRNTAKPNMIPPDKNVLRVGVSTNSPPLIFKQGDNVVGLEAEFARGLAAYLAKTLHFVELKWEDQIPALLENRIDIIMSGMTITTLREVRIAFSIPYFESGQMALIRIQDAARFSTGLFSLATSSAIGAIKDTTGDYYVETQFSSIKKKLYQNPKAAVKALIKKDIDMFIYDGPMVLYLASENENNGLTALFTPLTREYLAWGVRRDNVALLNSANDYLRSINEEGKLNKMIKYWIPLAK